MTEDLPTLPTAAVIEALKRHGYQERRRSSVHVLLAREADRGLLGDIEVVKIDGDMMPEVLGDIIRRSGIPKEEFMP